LPGGSLYPFHRALVPLIAGIGGTIGGALVYRGYLQMGDEQILAPGWPIASSADLVVAVATARAVFGRSPLVTIGLLVALTSDLIGLVTISQPRFITDVHPGAIALIAMAIAIAMILRRRGVRSSWPYLIGPGTLSWFGCYWLGVEPVLALLPVVPFFEHMPRELTAFVDRPSAHRSATHFESTFETPIQLVVLLFAFVNLGVAWRGYGTGTWAVMAGSLLGRPLGIVGSMRIAQFAGARLPADMGWKEGVVIALGTAPTFGFGVLMAVSVFPVGPLLVETKLGALGTTFGIAMALAAARLLRTGRFRAESTIRVTTRLRTI
jgi:Na+:H+ antiporter, NhaA family